VTRRPKIVVIDSEPSSDYVRSAIGDSVDLIPAKSAEEALDLLRKGEGDGIFTMPPLPLPPASQTLRISNSEILQRIATGIAVIDADFKVLWHNAAFGELCDGEDFIGQGIYEAIGCEEIQGPDFCPFTDCLAGTPQAKTQVRLRKGRYAEIRCQSIRPADSDQQVLLCLIRDITSEIQEREKMTAIHRAGLELGHLTAQELAQMTMEERIDLLKANILQHSQKILNFRFFEIRLLDPETKMLNVLLSEGMTQFANDRELHASREGNGVTGFVAVTGTSYLCNDVLTDPLYLPGAPGARSSMTVPMLYRDRVIGTFNVESAEANKFTESDREFLEIFAREIAVALNTLDLLEAEKHIGGSATIEAVVKEVSLPVDEIVTDTIRVLDFLLQPHGNKELAHEAVRRVLLNARAIKNAIQKVGQTVEQDRGESHGESVAEQPTRLTGKRVLVVDADPSIRRSAHVLLSQLGCEVDTAKDGLEGQQLVRTIEYDVVVADIRLPDMNGYDFFHSLKELIPKTPVVLMTGFGYDANHCIVRARQEGLASVLYKPFRLDRIREAVADAIHLTTGGTTSPSGERRKTSGLDMGAKQTIL